MFWYYNQCKLLHVCLWVPVGTCSNRTCVHSIDHRLTLFDLPSVWPHGKIWLQHIFFYHKMLRIKQSTRVSHKECNSLWTDIDQKVNLAISRSQRCVRLKPILKFTRYNKWGKQLKNHTILLLQGENEMRTSPLPHSERMKHVVPLNQKASQLGH